MKKLGLQIRKTKVNTQKIDGSQLDIFSIVIALFSIGNKEGRSHFFEEKFLLANISIDIVLGIPFFTMSNVEIDFVNCHIY